MSTDAPVPQTVEAIARLVTAANAPTTSLGAPYYATNDVTPFMLVPDGYSVENLEEYLAKPVAKRGLASLNDLESFCRYVGEHKDKETRIFLNNGSPPTFLAKLDFHGKDGSWHRHNARFQPVLSTQWQRWAQINNQVMTQQWLIAHLERSVEDVEYPSAASILELVDDISAHVESRFESKIGTNDNKLRVVYSEEITMTGGSKSVKAGFMDFPRSITTVFPVLKGGVRLSITWRLRPRVTQGALSFTLELPTAGDLLQREYDALAKQVEENTKIQPYAGSFE